MLCLSIPPPGHPSTGHTVRRFFSTRILYVPLSVSATGAYLAVLRECIDAMCREMDLLNMTFPHISHFSFGCSLPILFLRLLNRRMYFSCGIAFATGVPPATIYFVFRSLVFKPTRWNSVTMVFRSSWSACGSSFSMSPSSA